MALQTAVEATLNAMNPHAVAAPVTLQPIAASGIAARCVAAGHRAVCLTAPQAPLEARHDQVCGGTWCGHCITRRRISEHASEKA